MPLKSIHFRNLSLVIKNRSYEQFKEVVIISVITLCCKCSVCLFLTALYNLFIDTYIYVLPLLMPVALSHKTVSSLSYQQFNILSFVLDKTQEAQGGEKEEAQGGIQNKLITLLINGTARIKKLNSCQNTNIYSYLETSGGESSNLYLSVVHFFQQQCLLDICGSL